MEQPNERMTRIHVPDIPDTYGGFNYVDPVRLMKEVNTEFLELHDSLTGIHYYMGQRGRRESSSLKAASRDIGRAIHEAYSLIKSLEGVKTLLEIEDTGDEEDA